MSIEDFSKFKWQNNFHTLFLPTTFEELKRYWIDPDGVQSELSAETKSFDLLNDL